MLAQRVIVKQSACDCARIVKMSDVGRYQGDRWVPLAVQSVEKAMVPCDKPILDVVSKRRCIYEPLDARQWSSSEV